MATSTIKASGGTFPSAEAAKAYLVGIGTLTEPEIFECDAFVLNATTEAFGLSGIVTSPANYIEFRAAAGQEHTEVAGTGPRILTAAGGVTITANHVRFNGIEMYCSSTSQTSLSIPSTTTYSADSDIRIENCIIRGTKTGTGNVITCTGNGANVTFDKNIVYGSSRLLDARVLNAGTVKLRRNTFWGHASQILVLCDSHTVQEYGNYVGCAAAGAECLWSGGSAPLAGSHNATSDLTAAIDLPTGALTSIAGASVFTSVTLGSEDFSPLNGTTALHDAGVAVSGITADIVGTAIPQGAAPDIGAFEWPESGSSDATVAGGTGTGTGSGTGGDADGVVVVDVAGGTGSGSGAGIGGDAVGEVAGSATVSGGTGTGTGSGAGGDADGIVVADVAGGTGAGSGAGSGGDATGGVAATGSFTLGPLENAPGFPWLNQAVVWTATLSGRIGAMEGLTPIDGTGTTDATTGELLVSGLAAGEYQFDVAVLGATRADDLVYTQYGTVT